MGYSSRSETAPGRRRTRLLSGGPSSDARASPILGRAHSALWILRQSRTDMDLEQYVRVLRAHWLLILASIVVCVGAAAAFAWTRTPIYAARTQLFVATGGASADLSQTYQGGLFSQQRVLSYAQIVSSPPVVQAAMAQLGLRESVRKLQGKISASVPTDTVLINVTVKEQSPQRAKAIADAVGNQFATFVNRLESRPGEGSSPVKVSVTSQAQLPTEPVSPRKVFYLAFGALFGLALGIGGAVLREALDDRIRDEDDAAAIASAPVLGSIAEDPDAGRRPLIVVEDPFSVRAEAYRRLRTNIRVLSVDRGARSLVISSAVASEGKTLIAANLGVTFAQAGYRVILVDSDLREPNLADVLGLSSTVGLTDVLVDNLPVEAALQTWRLGLPLEVLGSGSQPPPNPSELLSSQRFATVLGILTDRVDVVILDAPALLPVTDAAILARLTSGMILVTRPASTLRGQLETATWSLHAVDEQALGVVLNRVPIRRAAVRHSSGYPSDRREADERGFGTDVPLHVPAREG
jgi:succinoglycan biosynthesis transport protein ExoP